MAAEVGQLALPSWTLLIALLLSPILQASAEMDGRRPIYVIGHMVNSIQEIEEYLDRGANVLEFDISFFDNGTVHRVYHGPGGDCDRDLYRSANLTQYLDYIRQITDSETGKYKDQLIFQFFDLKLANLDDQGKLTAGKEMADQVLDHLWKDTTDGHRVRVLLYINEVADNPTVVGFRQRFKERGVERLLGDVGYDGGLDASDDIKSMWTSIGVKSNVWQGDGTINCFSAAYTDARLRKELEIRDTREGYISKVYHWTIDDQDRMRQSLNLGVDGMITNVPERLVELVTEFSDKLRLATVQDDPFSRFTAIPDTQ